MLVFRRTVLRIHYVGIFEFVAYGVSLKFSNSWKILHFIIYIYIIQVTKTSIQIKLNWKFHFNGIVCAYLIFVYIYRSNQWIWTEQHNKSKTVRMFLFVSTLFFFFLLASQMVCYMYIFVEIVWRREIEIAGNEMEHKRDDSFICYIFSRLIEAVWAHFSII